MSINVLLVDDSSIMRKIIIKGLRQAGVNLGEVYEAADGFEGLQHLSSHEVGLILSDINMPNMDGLEFLRRIKELNMPKQIPIVMVTTEASEDTIKEAMNIGACQYLKKPFTAEQIHERLGFLWES